MTCQDIHEKASLHLPRILLLLLGISGVVALYALGRTNFLLYHTLTELAAISVTVSVFTIGWNTRNIAASDSLFLLAVAYGSVAVLDLMHTLGYSGMGVFPGRGADLPTQLWISARFVESTSLLAAALIINRRTRLSGRMIVTAYAAITAGLLLLIFPLDSFPSMYNAEEGLTVAKIAGEYFICAVLVLAIAMFWRKRAQFSRHNLFYLLGAITATIASELFFTLYSDIYGFFNVMGHLFKFLSFICIYQALVHGLLKQPYDGLFRKLAKTNESLRERENQLSAAEEELRTILDTVHSGIIMVDAFGVIHFANERAADMFRLDLDELLGSMYTDHVYNMESQQAEEQMFWLIRGGIDRVDTERLYVRSDGTYFWGALVGTRMLYPDGSFRGLVGIITDITDRKLAERELKENKEELEAIYQNAPLIMMLLDRDLRIRKANSYSSDFIGESEERMLGKQEGEVLSCLQHSDDPAGCGLGSQCEFCAIRNTVQDTFETGRSHHQVEATLTLLRQGRKKDLTFFVSSSLLRHKDENLVLVTIMDITERKKAESNLKYMSFHDSLTGLYNRNFFETEMTRLQDGRSRPVGIITCDLDGLKLINDSLGHQSGDEMIINAAEVLRNSFRSSDIIARIGGDEFAVLLPETDWNTARELTRRLREAVEEYNEGNPRISLSLSIGFAVSNLSPIDMQALFREADDRMYQEKALSDDSGCSELFREISGALETTYFINEKHSERIKELATSLALAVNMPEEGINDLVLLAQFHDLGKVAISDRILFKPGPLTEQEMLEMREHSKIGYRIAKSVPKLSHIAEWIGTHHERWDGRGYPRGLQGEEIPLPCRILAIADAYDAMISERPYSKGISPKKALKELKNNAGTQFDPYLVDQFVEIIETSSIN